MVDLDQLIRQLEQSGKDVFWQGNASQASVRQLESLLGSQLPASFKAFLVNYGGGGVVGEEVSGIEDDVPELQYKGTVYGDTLRCREDFALPDNLVVIYLDAAGDVVWCLDVGQLRNDECPVVAFDVVHGTARPLARNFAAFLKEYLMLRIAS